MADTEYDINVKQGSTYKIVLTLTDPDENPLDLTGYTFEGQVRTSTSDPTIQAPFTFEILTQTGLTLGQVVCTLTATATRGIKLPENDGSSRKLTKMIYDIEGTNGDEVVRWLQGAAIISPEVTK